jgi:subtilase family serine protease
VHAMAPGAHVLFVGGADCLDESLIDAVNKIVDGGLAQIVSNSYGNLGETGEDAGLRQAWNDTFRQAALEGIGMYYSSGDSGDETDNLGHAEADFPASHPLVTAVGGTSLGVSSSDGYLFETGWARPAAR